MLGRRTAFSTIGLSALALVVVVGIVIGAEMFVVNTSQSASTVTSSQSIRDSLIVQKNCDSHPYAQNLLSTVQSNPSVVQAASIGSHWILGYDSNESGYSSNQSTTLYFDRTVLYFYSVDTGSLVSCNLSPQSITYLMRVSIPISSTGSYDFNAVSAYTTRYYSNSTISST